MRRLLTRFRRDERGATAMIFAFAAVALIGASAMAVDVMSFYRQKRILQTGTDLAAMAAAADLTHANALAAATLDANAKSATILSLETGTYTASSSVAASARFTPGGSPPNAVRMRTQIIAPYYLGSIFNMRAQAAQGTGATIGAAATAMRSDTASFGVGARLAALNAGALNTLLSAMTGSTVSLSLLDYQSLAAAKIDMFAYSRDLAARIGLSTGDYNGLLQTSTSPGNAIATLAQDAAGVTAGASELLRQTASLLPSTGLQIGQLAEAGPYGSDPLSSLPSVQLPVRALDLLTGLATLSTNGQQIGASTAVDAAGISAKVLLSVGAPAKTVAAGAPPISASTGQVRLQVTFNVPVAGLGTLTVPISVQAARATAQLDDVTCPLGQPSAATARLLVTPSVLNAGLGTLSDLDSSMANGRPQPTPILTIPLVASVTAAAATASGTQTTPFTFTMDDASAGTIKTASSGSPVGGLAASLIGGMQLNVKVLGLNLGIAPTIKTQITTALAAATPSMDATLSGLLNTLGIGIGQADSWVSTIHCGGSVLVN